MTSSHRRFVLMFAAIFAAVAVSGLAQWRRPGAWGYSGLNLTDEQMNKIQEARLSFQKILMPLQLEWEKAQFNADNLYAQRADQKQIDAALQKINELEMEIEKAFRAHRDQVRNLLDEKQRAVFDRYGGLGLGPVWGDPAGWGMRPGWGRGAGPAWGTEFRGSSPGWGYGYGRGWGRGMGRGYYCPWNRWR
ncbi:MAG: hypothetical protein JW747_00090 [Candidatus Aminicenantes bacterium]|nr:hypothetical protein [Candidatus Aminicenantes bacterium]